MIRSGYGSGRRGSCLRHGKIRISLQQGQFLQLRIQLVEDVRHGRGLREDAVFERPNEVAHVERVDASLSIH